MKELLPNEWEEYANTHGVGDVVVGTVTNITDFGVFIELSPGVEGLCHISEIDRDTGASLLEIFSQNQAVRCRILRIDWNENRIGLSMHGLSQDEAEDDVASVASGTGSAGGGADTAMAAALRAGGLLPADEEDADGEGLEAGDDTVDEETAAADAPATEEAVEATSEGDADPEGEEHAAASDEAEDVVVNPDEPATDDDAVVASDDGASDDTSGDPVAESADDETTSDDVTADDEDVTKA